MDVQSLRRNTNRRWLRLAGTHHFGKAGILGVLCVFPILNRALWFMCVLMGFQAEAASEASSQEEDGSDGSRPAKKRRKGASKSAKSGGKTKAVAKGGRDSARGSPSLAASPLKPTAAPGGRLKRRRTLPEGTQSCLSHWLQDASPMIAFPTQQDIQICLADLSLCNLPLVSSFFRSKRNNGIIQHIYCHIRLLAATTPHCRLATIM